MMYIRTCSYRRIGNAFIVRACVCVLLHGIYKQPNVQTYAHSLQRVHAFTARSRPVTKKLAKYRAAMHAKEVFIDLVHNLLRTKLK